ncbi:MAG: hypothetical protein V4687_13775 [Bacteroidota bacterium]
MSDNPIILDVSHPLFMKRETWLRKRLEEALNQPFISFSEVISKYEMGIYLIYDKKELLYIGMTTRPGHNRIKEIIAGFKKHTFNRKLMAQQFRHRGYTMHVLSTKNHKRDWIENGLISTDEFKEVQQEVNQKIKQTFRFKFYEFKYFNIEFLEHYAIATLQPLYND